MAWILRKCLFAIQKILDVVKLSTASGKKKLITAAATAWESFIRNIQFPSSSAKCDSNILVKIDTHEKTVTHIHTPIIRITASVFVIR